jgi:4-hydroxy-tetrahydrodipicolinate synthase
MKTTEKRPLTGGIVCALATPFAPDESLDRSSLEELIDFQIAAGVDGIFVAGTAGEGPLLLREERQLLAAASVDRVAGRVPLVVHCGAPDTRTAEFLARDAQDIGADVVATVAPYFYKVDAQSLYSHFRDVAEAAPELSHFLYENPERVGYSLGADLVGRLIREVSGIVGIKDTGDSIGRLTIYLSTLDPPPEVYAGNNAIVLPALTIGAKGAVSALCNAVPEPFVMMYESFVKSDLQEAAELQSTIARLQASLTGLPYIPAIKHLMAMRGLPTAASRRPHPEMSPEQRRNLEERLKRIEDLQPWLKTL